MISFECCVKQVRGDSNNVGSWLEERIVLRGITPGRSFPLLVAGKQFSHSFPFCPQFSLARIASFRPPQT